MLPTTSDCGSVRICQSLKVAVGHAGVGGFVALRTCAPKKSVAIGYQQTEREGEREGEGAERKGGRENGFPRVARDSLRL